MKRARTSALTVIELAFLLAPTAPIVAQVGPAERNVIQDPRLDSDSTLFPYEWPALNALERDLAGLRPVLESGAVRELAEALPAIEARVERLVADSLPTLLVPRREEVRGRMIALRSAVQRARELAPAALAAPARSVRESPMLTLGEPGPGVGNGGLLDTTGGAAQGDWRLDRAGVTPEEGDAQNDTVRLPEAAATPTESLQAAGADTGDQAAVDPIGVYFDAWRDIYVHAEALVHRVRNPLAES